MQGHIDGTTLTDGQRLVDKLTYRFRDPPAGRAWYSNTPAIPPEFIKRVIGIPGDVVAIRDNALPERSALEGRLHHGPPPGIMARPPLVPRRFPKAVNIVLGRQPDQQ